MHAGIFSALLASLPQATSALRFDSDYEPWNLNQNQDATHPRDYWGEWDNHTFFPSPTTWRFPFYTLTQDRFVDGDPTNNEANGTKFEHDWMSNQFRFGGDMKGIRGSIDYLQGMGIKGIYLTGSPFLNMPWAGHGYDPLDFTLLDAHWGVIQDWRDTIDALHARGIYIILDNTMSTMGDMLTFKGWENITTVTPFNWNEYDYDWKLPNRRYHDFAPSNEFNSSCVYPRMWDLDGFPLKQSIKDQENGCRASEFDSYGAILGTGAYPVYQNQLSKFASVQDRLREWQAPVLEKIKVMSCIQIAMLDIDGFRMDKGVQITVDAQAEFADYQRKCARRYGKDNFLIVGEIVASPQQGSVYVGRGKQPDMVFKNTTEAMMANGNTTNPPYIREFGLSALDGSAFQYEIYGAMTRFLGLSGPFGIRGTDWVEFWNGWLLPGDDMVNVNTGLFDPRQFFGMTNQDVFRWPALAHGTARQLLGWFVMFLEFPGVPMILFGEEQEFYTLENLAPDYVFGRMPMSSQSAWQIHGCYMLGEVPYVDVPFNASGHGCEDQSLSLDHRDPSHPLRNVIKRMWEMRAQFPVLNDGYQLGRLSETHYDIQLYGSNVPTTIGIWSDYRARQVGIQDLTDVAPNGNTPVWMVYTNENMTRTYDFDCSSPNENDTLLAPYPAGTVVKDLFYPYTEYTLEMSIFTLGIENSPEINGCISNFTIPAWGHHAFVPKQNWIEPAPVITKVIPSHDERLLSSVGVDGQESVAVQIRFSREMDCDSITRSFNISSSTHSGRSPKLNSSSVVCTFEDTDPPRNIGEVATAFIWAATLENVYNGVHRYTINNVSSADGTTFTNAVDNFLFRVGQINNPMVFPWFANYTTGIYQKQSNGSMVLTPVAPGADLFRYSTNWGSSYSDWMPYTGENLVVEPQTWTGTRDQGWKGNHLLLNYWSEFTGSADHVQHVDLDSDNDAPPQRWPHAWVQGAFNQYGFDSGLSGQMEMKHDTGLWGFDLADEWPSRVLVNVWGMNPDGQPDKTMAYGDIDGDGVLDWIAPDSLATNLLNISSFPPSPHLGWRIEVNDGTYGYKLSPVGNRYYQLALGIIFGIVPVLTGILAVWLFMRAFMVVKFNEIGIREKKSTWFIKTHRTEHLPTHHSLHSTVTGMFNPSRNNSHTGVSPGLSPQSSAGPLEAAVGATNRRQVLMATMEYQIEDWNISVKIGGLGVMANLMGKHLGHQDIFWVVPCVGGIDYPVDEPADPMFVTIFNELYEVHVQYHRLRNITYVLLDAPVFRKQTKAEPYPARMDDLDSAVYYSAWNQCIAQAIERFNVDLFHINDYHCAIAPLYLLPKTLPCAFSVHNAEFQGLWAIRTPQEKDEISKVFNLPVVTVEKYVQFGEIFNMLHAAASYLRIHQRGFGAVGVSNKYGKRSWARYPIFWGLQKVGGLPNPDPSDTGDWDKQLPEDSDIIINHDFEVERLSHREQAQEWAGLKVDQEAELFVFVGRWSNQKGVDLIADVFFSILEENSKVQLICIGPVIDLYGKFAALKLDKMMKKYPGRVCSKPVFTALPPFIFSGAEFALIPSRDEPFGLVAVEFGRKGAIGVGARVGGLGQMPGWWYTVESTAPQHLMKQFKSAIRAALASKKEVRQMMRARSAVQRFPVAQWIEDMDKLHVKATEHFASVASHPTGILSRNRSTTSIQTLTSGKTTPSGIWSPMNSVPGTATNTAPNTAPNTRPNSRNASRAPSPEGDGSEREVTPPSQVGPGHDVRSGRFLNVRRFSSSRRNSNDRDSATAIRRPSNPRLNTTEEAQRQAIADSTAPGTLRKSKSSRHLRLASTISEGNEIGAQLDRIVTGRVLGETPEQANDTSTSNLHLTEEIRRVMPELERTGSTRHQKKIIGHSASGRFIRSSSSKSLAGLNADPLSPIVSPGSWAPGTPGGQVKHLDQNQHKSVSSMSRRSSILDLNIIKNGGEGSQGEKKNYKLEKVDPFFNDPTGLYFRSFDEKLDQVNAKNSESTLCIEEYLVKSEKNWFSRYHDARLGGSGAPTLSEKGSFFKGMWSSTTSAASSNDSDSSSQREESKEQFLISSDYHAPRGVRKWLMFKVGEWPLYTFLLALGQIMAINSYQIPLLTGEVGQSANKLYVIASIYLAASMGWWVVYRSFQSIWCLTLPFVLYGLAFFLLGINPYSSSVGKEWINNVATAIYAVAASSGCLFFALNFSTDGGAPVKSWIFRACTITGTQQIYIAALWYWGAQLANTRSTGIASTHATLTGWRLTAVTIPIAALLWTIGIVLVLGLPSYYRNTPGGVPNFYRSFWRRKIVIWFFVSVIIQNYFLSATYGRNWTFLWTTKYAPKWAIAILVVAFFVFVWGSVMWCFHRLSKAHTWLLPMFAVGLGAPRWCQMLWATSGMALYVPFGGTMGGALLARCLWLWLGVLDTVQGVGFGMMLLQTLTRHYIVFAMLAAQVIGSLFTIAARASGPDATGPGSVFPNLALNLQEGVSEHNFWIGLSLQLVVCAGFAMFFRKEQLSKP